MPNTENRAEDRIEPGDNQCDVTFWQSQGKTLRGDVQDYSPRGIGVVVDSDQYVDAGFYAKIVFDGKLVYGKVSNVLKLEDGRFRIGVEVSERLHI